MIDFASPYEFIKDGNGKTKEFPLFVDRSAFTDDSVMSIVEPGDLKRP